MRCVGSFVLAKYMHCPEAVGMFVHGRCIAIGLALVLLGLFNFG